MKSLCVYCGSKKGENPAFAQTAEELGAAMAQQSVELIYGGGKVGIMGVIADAVLKAGGHVQGVIPESLLQREVGHTGIQHLHVTEDMHTRKALLEQLSDAFLVLPGGFGTLDELFEIVTWRQLGFHSKPIMIFNVEGYFDPLIAFINNSIQNKFVVEENRDLIKVIHSIDEALQF